MRVVGGRFRGRRLVAPSGSEVRPTSDRAREAIFNVLYGGRLGSADPVTGQVIVDAFAGTGAMAVEALSRGAAGAVLLETDEAARRAIAANLYAMGLADRARVLAADATRPPRADRSASLAFLDPPYGADLTTPALIALAQQGWLAPDAIVVVELARGETWTAPARFAELDRRTYSAAQVRFLRHQSGEDGSG